MTIFSAFSSRAISPARIKCATTGIMRKAHAERTINETLRALTGTTRVKLVGVWDLQGVHHARVMKRAHGALIGFNYLRLGVDTRYRAFSARLAPLVAMLCRARGVDSAVVDVSDGEECEAGIIGFCARTEGAILVPDEEFCASRGYQEFRSVRRNVRWDERADTITWRGATTGHGVVSRASMVATDRTLLQRTRMCLLLRDQPDANVAFAKVVQVADSAEAQQHLRQAGILAERLDGYHWWQQKYALDIDGNTNAWSNLFTRLLMGCCVLKVASPRLYRQWYYGDLRPWEHYVPVSADLTDLIEKLSWCRSRPRESREIAARGQEFARRRTFDTEFDAAVARIEAALGKSAVAAG